MRILAYNPCHDGAAVLIENGRLSFALESEKDDGQRYDSISPTLFVRSLAITEPPDVVVVSGYIKGARSAKELLRNGTEAGYFDEGPTGTSDSETLFVGRRVRRFSSSHVRSHIMCTYGLSPFPQGQPCYVLIWEGWIGALYHVDEHVVIRKIGDVLSDPGDKYSILYGLADPSLPVSARHWLRGEDAGKLMALAAYGRRDAPTSEQQGLIESIMSWNKLEFVRSGTSPKAALSSSRFCDIGVESQDFKDLAWQFSAALFDRFYLFAKEHVMQGLPLLIAGGCGLNCEWNTHWRQCGLFADVFVPPCPNDSGVALGAAIDALRHYTGRAKIEWTVYAGDPFIEDVAAPPDFSCSALNLSDVCLRLLNGDVIAWVQGRYEIGPRALGNRSLLAAPFSTESRDKLNRIKQRESFRPIAPICLEDEFGLHFDHHGPSPHMLYFQRVKSGQLTAITHVDGSARAQSVNDSQNPEICALLREFREQSGVAVLCNTSLNFKGRGFINRMSHLFEFARESGIDGLVVGTRFWKPRRRGSSCALGN